MADESLQERRFEKQQDQQRTGQEARTQEFITGMASQQEARTQELIAGMTALWTPILQANLTVCKGLVDAGQAMLIGFEVLKQQRKQHGDPTQQTRW